MHIGIFTLNENWINDENTTTYLEEQDSVAVASHCHKETQISTKFILKEMKNTIKHCNEIFWPKN